MQKEQKDEIVHAVCKVIQSQRKNKKEDFIEPITIFRILTNKKIFPYEFDIDQFNIESVSIEDSQFCKFVFDVNPFFKPRENANLEKTQYYKKYFYITKCIYDDVQKLFSKRREAKYFCLYDVTNQTDVHFDNFPDCEKNGVAYFFTHQEAVDALKKYSAAYNALGLELIVSLRHMNQMHEVIQEETIDTSLS